MQELYSQYKGLLFKLAYQLTGSVSDAEDAVQDVFLKAYDVPRERLANPKAYLCKMVTNRCLDLNKAARKKREEYFGEWLPEPFLSSEDDSMESVVLDDLLSYAMLVLLERLSPAERSVFVLREALSFDYLEIAELIEKSEANCRKLFSRASAKMGLSQEELIPHEGAGQEWVQDFLAALKQGNMNQILSMLDQDVVLVSDGGGKVQAAVDPIVTRGHVARFLLGPVRQASTIGGEVVIEMGRINGQYGIILRSSEGIHTVGMFHVENHLIRNFYFVRNPDKLKHVGK
ncbi:RNA polymerase sigma factor SigJ [Paenibacillus eucommiae]|uniref:RNA polymerase sigma-70 factor (ECF subfamily) n=1 Tax=Paenibacillus eucommiae TaxID=1355755 RepID=A0ABS4IPX5_9BACL|nr:RNA polymerase sigma factor SigJ [Paenibacillus eucommiae]MBP1989622.1 RNA polymerase sigma-70 factor (ECF subfamily) [Paenibacillus eucommiae]